MKPIRFSISKHSRILFILLLINLLAFFTTQSMAEKYSPQKPSVEELKNMNILEQGWQIVNWSYNLLKYFKKPHTTYNHG